MIDCRLLVFFACGKGCCGCSAIYVTGLQAKCKKSGQPAIRRASAVPEQVANVAGLKRRCNYQIDTIYLSANYIRQLWLLGPFLAEEPKRIIDLADRTEDVGTELKQTVINLLYVCRRSALDAYVEIVCPKGSGSARVTQLIPTCPCYRLTTSARRGTRPKRSKRTGLAS